MLKYWLWLATRKGLGARGAYLVARYFQTPEEAYFADPRTYELISGLRSPQALLDKDLSKPEEILRQCYEKNIYLMTIQDAAYPSRLRALEDPPVVLYCKGVVPDLNGPVVSVVGTRHGSLYGMTQARRMGYGLSRCGCTVVSGGAVGIDAEAMKGALLGGSPVIGVTGCGLDVAYPKENQTLFRDVMEHGCLISEYPPGVQPSREHFPVRNRIISGMSLGVLVVEAPERSGALITAHRALDQGRDVFALPANVGQSTGEGNLQLLRDGAILVRDAWDILQEYEALYPDTLKLRNLNGWQGDQSPAEPEPPKVCATKKPIDKEENRNYIGAKTLPEDCTPQEKQLMELLQDGQLHIDTIAEAMGQPPGSVLAQLTMLEVRGWIRRLPGRKFALAQNEN